MNLFFNALAINETGNTKGGENVGSDFSRADGYIKNSIVSLLSAKRKNINAEVAIMVNFRLPKEYETIFEKNQIKVCHVPFRQFRFPDQMKWSLAFYKLCALEYAVNQLEYDNYCMVDTDTVCCKSLEDMWRECEKYILLYDMEHGLSIAQTKQMNKEYRELTKEADYLTNYGGEFIAGNRRQLQFFVGRCVAYYEKMLCHNVRTLHGDEFLISSAAAEKEVKAIVKAANPYIHRYWTDRFYLISTNHVYNPVCILHLPDEKNRGMICLYQYIRKYDRLPDKNRLFAMINLPGESKWNNWCRWIKHLLYIKFLKFLYK